MTSMAAAIHTAALHGGLDENTTLVMRLQMENIQECQRQQQGFDLAQRLQLELLGIEIEDDLCLIDGLDSSMEQAREFQADVDFSLACALLVQVRLSLRTLRICLCCAIGMLLLSFLF